MLDSILHQSKGTQKNAEELRARVRDHLQEKRRKPSPEPPATSLTQLTVPAPKLSKPTVAEDNTVDAAPQLAKEAQKDAANHNEKRARLRVVSILEQIVTSQNANSRS